MDEPPPVAADLGVLLAEKPSAPGQSQHLPGEDRQYIHIPKPPLRAMFLRRGGQTLLCPWIGVCQKSFLTCDSSVTRPALGGIWLKRKAQLAQPFLKTCRCQREHLLATGIFMRKLTRRRPLFASICSLTGQDLQQIG